MGIALLAARSMTSDLQADTEARGQVLDLIRSSQPVGIALVAVGVLALAVQIVVEPRGAAVLRVLSAAGKGMRLGPNQLTLRRTRWRRGWRKRRLVSGVLRYAPGQVTEDLGAELTEALGPFVVGDLLIRWEPDRDRFVLRQRPATNPRMEERHSTVGTMTRTLEHILGGLIVDQDQTNVSDSGEVSQFVATYPQTTRDLAESFRQRLKVILDAKTPCPTGYWMVKLDPASSRITVQPSQPMPRLAELPLVALTPADRMRIPVGVAAGGQIIHWEPASSPAHAARWTHRLREDDLHQLHDRFGRCPRLAHRSAGPEGAVLPRLHPRVPAGEGTPALAGDQPGRDLRTRDGIGHRRPLRGAPRALLPAEDLRCHRTATPAPTGHHR